MNTITGKAVVGDIARGTLVYYHKSEFEVTKGRVVDTELELKRFMQAREASEEELQELYDEALERLGEENAQIFIIHQMLMSDAQFERCIISHISEDSYNAEYAVKRAALELVRMLSANGSDYVKERTADIRDVSDRLIRHLLNVPSKDIKLEDNAIICAEELMPSEALMFDRKKLAGLCMAAGAVNSHASILAKSMNIPCIVCMGEKICEELDGKEAVVDGYEGVLYVEPDEMTIRLAEERVKSEQRKLEILSRLIGKATETADGRSVRIYANVYNLAEVENAAANDAEGIGIFRSESLYIAESVFPNEELLFYNYRRVLEDMKGREVTLLTYDMSAENTEEILDLKKEPNPAMGYRSIRVCLEQQDLFRTQIRAMLRASVYGKMSILLPMIIDVGEFRYARSIINDEKEKLREEGKAFSEDIKIGAMIETPAAVITSDILAKEADFFSIGTNDLEQFTLALDKNNSKYDRIRPENSTAILRMIRMVCENAHKNGIPVVLCGELASDFSLTEVFLDMNVDVFSVAPPRVLPLRRVIRSMDLSDEDRAKIVVSQLLEI
jgi:phosphotransferase system enzyme I (PtsI)